MAWLAAVFPAGAWAQDEEGHDCSLPRTTMADELIDAARLKDEETRFLIATFPDPSDPPSALTFDRFVDAIVAAAHNAGFVLDSHAFPWKRPRVGEAKRDEADPLEEHRHRLLHPESEELGAILFRATPTCAVAIPISSDEPTGELILRHHTAALPSQELQDACKKRRALVVLIVAETPTHGIESQAFKDAMALVRHHRQKKEKIHILGPSYSGSAGSLARAIDGCPGEDFEVISGSATNYEAYDVVTRGKSTFHSTMIPDQILQEAITHFLLNVLEVDPKDIGILVEQDSSYGQGIIESSRQVSLRRRSALASGLMVLPFPMNISSIRETKEHTDKEQTEKPARPEDELIAPRSKIELSLEIGEPTHVPPDYSHASVISSELVINTILSQINRYKFKYIGIASSEPADRIFLGRLIRRANPDLTIFFVESDVLYTHEDLSEEFYGSLVVSTYPLFPRNQIWSYPYRGQNYQTLFPAGPAEGLYNAALFQLGLDAGETTDVFHAPLEYGGLFRLARPPSFFERFERVFRDDSSSLVHPADIGGMPVVLRPPVWISAVGHQTFTPLIAYYPYGARFVRTVCGAAPLAESAAPDLVKAGEQCLSLADEARRFVVGFDDQSDKKHEADMELLTPPLAATFLLIIMSIFAAMHGATCVAALGRRERDETPVAGEGSSCDERVEGHPMDELRALMRAPDTWFSKWFEETIRAWWCWQLFDLSKQRTVGGMRTGLYASMLLVILLVSNSFLARWFLGYPFMIATRTPWGWAFATSSAIVFLLSTMFTARGLSEIARAFRPQVAPWVKPAAWALAGVIVLYPYRASFTFSPSYDVWDDVSRFVGLVLYASRVTDVFSRLSPAVPVIAFAAMGYTWSTAQIMRWRGNWEIARALFKGDLPPVLRRSVDEVCEIKLRLERWFYRLRGSVAVFAVVVFCVYGLKVRLGPTLDGRAFANAFFACFALCFSSISYQVLRLFGVWLHVRRLLAALAETPLIEAFGRLPKHVWRDLPARVFSFSTTPVERRLGLTTAIELLEILVKHVQVIRPGSGLLSSLEDALLKFEQSGRRSGGREEQEVFAEGDRRVLPLLADAWSARPTRADLDSIQTRLAAAEHGTETVSAYGSAIVDAETLWVRLAEDYAAARFTDLIELILAQVRSILAYCTVVLLLLLITVNLYPFEPLELIKTIILVAGSVVIASAIVIFVQMNRDEVMSRISGTEGGEVSWGIGFVTQLAVYAVIPLLTVLTTQVPGIGKPLVKAIAALLHNIK